MNLPETAPVKEDLTTGSASTPFQPDITSRARPVILLLLGGAFLLGLPNFIECFFPYKNPQDAWLWLFGCVLMLQPFALPFRTRALLLLWLPVLLVLPAVLACLASTGAMPSSFLVLALQESDMAELSVFRNEAMLTAIGTLLLLASSIFAVWRIVPPHFRLPLPIRRNLIAVFVLLLAIEPLTSKYANYLLRLKETLLINFPTSSAYAVVEAFEIRRSLRGRQDILEHSQVQTLPATKTASREVNLLVIGESARRNSFGLYGYHRDTTPRLSRVPGLLAYHDVTAPAPVTLLAVPHLLTPTPLGQILDTSSQPSILTAYRKAGFRVYWLSTQRRHGAYDTLTSIFAEDAHEARFLGGAFDTEGQGCYAGKKDIHLLPEVESILARGEEKVLIVLHTMGSHGPYTARSIQGANPFPATREEANAATNEFTLTQTLTPRAAEVLTNAYDNSIVATDLVLANLIRILEGTQARSWLCYVSDHGENMGDSAKAFKHGSLTPDVLQVPYLLWLSPQHRQGFPEKSTLLSHRLDQPFSATSTYHTLLDLGGLRTPEFDPTKSIASPDFKAAPRLVYSGSKIVDYDADVKPLHDSPRQGWRPIVPKALKIAAEAAASTAASTSSAE